MNWLASINKIEEDVFWLGLFSLIFLLAPGLLLFFCCDRDLFLSLDTAKLILLSVSIVAPFAFMQTLGGVSATQKSKKVNLMLEFFSGIVVTNLGFYVVFLINYLGRLSFTKTVFTLITIQFVLLVLNLLSSGAKK